MEQFSKGKTADWETIRKAYVYTLPLMLMDATIAKMTNTETATSRQAPANQLIHAGKLAGADDRDVVTPNVDTVYSQVCLDLSGDAVVFRLPSAERFCSAEVMDAWSNCVTVLGTGSASGDGSGSIFLFTGPSFCGSVPEGMREVRMLTGLGWVLIRTVCRGTEDMENVRAIQSQMYSGTLMRYQKGLDAPRGSFHENRNDVPAVHVAALGPEEYFRRANELMAGNPPSPADRDILREIEDVSVGPGLAFDASVLGTEASSEWKKMLSGLVPYLTKAASGFIVKRGVWTFYGRPIAEFGTEYAYRALIALGGFGANPVSVAIYPRADTDEDGNQLEGSSNYVIHFEAEQLPPVRKRGFWSVTAYQDSDNLLIDNPIGRYCVNDRSPFVCGENGSLDIVLSKTKPSENPSNWLPVGEGGFHLVLRIYLPDASALSGTWKMPAIRKMMLQ